MHRQPSWQDAVNGTLLLTNNHSVSLEFVYYKFNRVVLYFVLLFIIPELFHFVFSSSPRKVLYFQVIFQIYRELYTQTKK